MEESGWVRAYPQVGVGTGRRTPKGFQISCLTDILERSGEHTLEFNVGIIVLGVFIKHVISYSDNN